MTQIRIAGRPCTALLCLWAFVLLPVYLWPFSFTASRPFFLNDAVPTAAPPGITFHRRGMLTTRTPPAGLHARLTGGTGLTVEAVVTPATAEAIGPARIVTYSAGTGDRNVTLAQERAALDVRLRASPDDPNGIAELASVPRVFEAGRRLHLAVTYDFATLKVFVDGALRAAFDRRPGNLSSWDPEHYLVIGNERSGDRPWRGTVARVALYDRALSQAAIRTNAEADGRSAGAPPPVVAYDFAADPTGAPVRGPESLRVHRPSVYANGNAPHLLARSGRGPADFALGFAAFLATGALLGTCLTRRFGAKRRILALAAILVVAAAVAAEAAQYFVDGRTSALIDLAGAVSGGLTGILAASRWRRAETIGSR